MPTYAHCSLILGEGQVVVTRAPGNSFCSYLTELQNELQECMCDSLLTEIWHIPKFPMCQLKIKNKRSHMHGCNVDCQDMMHQFYSLVKKKSPFSDIIGYVYEDNFGLTRKNWCQRWQTKLPEKSEVAVADSAAGEVDGGEKLGIHKEAGCIQGIG